MFDWLFGRKRPANRASQKDPGRQTDGNAPQVRAIPKFPFPLETVHGLKALETYDRLRAEGRGTPVILGHDEALHRHARHLASPTHETVDAIEQRAIATPFPDAWREKRRQELAALYGEDDDIAVPSGNWPQQVVPQDFLQNLDTLTRKPLERVHIALLPTRDPTLVPAFLRYGGWNECPDAAGQVAAARHWKTRFGAEIIAVADDVVHYRVQRRPATRSEAMELAREQYDFCPDIVLQETDNLEHLAAILMESDWWLFWWD
jgi:hypothetical protein